ncbi:hypothetical protein [uncultured Akkermansia sp.]|uniref:hypothetical protein n=1 Tax=uncultured Akkermansia sp. TaxID=512294 RepID=UPI0028059B7A|nr:hypothetical protein [uncultured Akkermansia sp.]
MTPAVANLALAKGTAYDVALVIQDAAAQPIDLAGFTLEASIRAASDTAPVDLAVIVTDAAAGLATVRIPAQPLGMGAWELWMQAAPETPRERALRGLVTVSETVDPREKENPSSHRLIVRVSDTVTVIVDAVDLAWWAYTRAVKAQLETASLAATWPQTVSNGEQAVNTAKNDALDALQNKQADAVLAVGRAQKTATDKIAGAQTAAVSAVQAAGEDAKETIEPLVRRAETAKDDIDQAERLINTAATDAATSATSAANSATAAQQALAALPQVDASGNMTLPGNITAAGGTFDGAMNANGGVNIPLAVGAPTDMSAVNRLYAAGLAAVTDAFSVRCYPLLADCSSSNGTVFKTDKEPNSLYFNVPPNSAFTVKCGLVTNARPMHNYSSIRGWVAPLRLPSVSTKFTARFGQITTVARMGRDKDAFTLVPDQAAGGYKIGEIIDITFDHVRDAAAGGYHIRVREIYYSNAEQKWKMKTTQALAPEPSINSGYPVCVYAVVYEQYQDGGYDTEDRGALWLLHGGNSSRGCVKIATVKGVHCFERIYPFSGYYLDMENANSWALSGAFLPATMHLHCNNVNPAYYGFSSMESNIIVSEAVEDFVDPEAETTTED